MKIFIDTANIKEIKEAVSLGVIDGVTTNPNTLWPPNHKMVDINIGGSATDSLSGIALTNFNVEDEYNTVEPTISGFNTTIQLESWREGNDKDGRV